MRKKTERNNIVYIYIHTYAHSLVELNMPSDISIVEKE
jgi:hypothetical protein